MNFQVHVRLLNHKLRAVTNYPEVDYILTLKALPKICKQLLLYKETKTLELIFHVNHLRIIFFYKCFILILNTAGISVDKLVFFKNGIHDNKQVNVNKLFGHEIACLIHVHTSDLLFDNVTCKHWFALEMS